MRTVTQPLLFGLTLFLGAGLLFTVEPMIARMVLPQLGGSPEVWTTCMLFFQAALLAGYGFVHATDRLSLRGQAGLQIFTLLAAFWFLPLTPPREGAVGTFSRGPGPTWVLLLWLVRSAGLPFIGVATTAPRLQRWFSWMGPGESRDPYFLYAASNAGSLAALAAYPLWVERRLSLGDQSNAWTWGLAVLTGMVAACAVVANSRTRGPEVIKEPVVGEQAARTGWIPWVILGFIPSSLLLGVTTFLTTDLAAIPLLWVIPLALYLLSFVVEFSRASRPAAKVAGRVLPLLVMVQAPVMVAGLVQPVLIPLHLATFFAAAVVCHGELARRRPGASRLTAFYLAIAAGGALGGVGNAVVAPLVFDRLAEYPTAVVASCMVLAYLPGVPGAGRFGRRDLILPAIIGLLAAGFCANLGGMAERPIGAFATTAASGLAALVAFYHRRRPARFALGVGSLLLAGGLYTGESGRVLYRERSFFGVLRVTEVSGMRVHRLFHGSTLHGQQDLSPARRREPSTYFDRSGPIGQVFSAFDARPAGQKARVAVTGVGAGSLAAYALPAQSWTFYEIDPAVVRVARDPRFFTYLSDSRAGSVAVVLGDARLMMARAPDGGYDLIILDAFSSDAIPTHLLTREALALDRRKRSEGGLIVINITNRYLDLAPVVGRLADDAGMVCRVRVDPGSDRVTGKQGSIWAVMSDREDDLGALKDDDRWFRPRAGPGDRAWTDDSSNLIDHLRFSPPRPRKGGPQSTHSLVPTPPMPYVREAGGSD